MSSAPMGPRSTSGVGLTQNYAVYLQDDGLSLNNAEATASALAMGTLKPSQQQSVSTGGYPLGDNSYRMPSGMQSGYASAQNASLFFDGGNPIHTTNSASPSGIMRWIFYDAGAPSSSSYNSTPAAIPTSQIRKTPVSVSPQLASAYNVGRYAR